MNALHALVDIAACLSVTANTEASRNLAVRKRHEAAHAIAEAQAELDHYRAVLALFPASGVMSKGEAHVR